MSCGEGLTDPWVLHAQETGCTCFLGKVVCTQVGSSSKEIGQICKTSGWCIATFSSKELAAFDKCECIEVYNCIWHPSSYCYQAHRLSCPGATTPVHELINSTEDSAHLVYAVSLLFSVLIQMSLLMAPTKSTRTILNVDKCLQSAWLKFKKLKIKKKKEKSYHL